MLTLTIQVCKTVFRKADFDETKGRTWATELKRLKLDPITTEFTSCIGYAWVTDDAPAPADGDPAPDPFDTPAVSALLDVLADNGRTLFRRQPTYTDDVAPWFTLTVGIDHPTRRKPVFTDVTYQRHAGCPVAVSLAAMADRAALKRAIKSIGIHPASCEEVRHGS